MSSSTSFSAFDSRLREFIRRSLEGEAAAQRESNSASAAHAQLPGHPDTFESLVRDLFALQYESNAAYRRLCESRRISPSDIKHWNQIPSVPTAAFKELDLSCLPIAERTAVFHSSGTTEQRPSRHFHHVQSLSLYAASALPWFKGHMLAGFEAGKPPTLVVLTPPPPQVPHSSLVHMFETVRQDLGTAHPVFYGAVAADGAWSLEFAAVMERLSEQTRAGRPVMLLGTAFLFVHLLDELASRGLRLALPPGSRVLETGGYKGRSRSLPKAELHALITERLGIPPTHIVCEYGMSELSSQAYDRSAKGEGQGTSVSRCFHFPPWARVQLISPETGREVREGETGLIRIFDLANAFSVMAIQTEDLGVRRGAGFELLGRAALAEPRGCSLMAS